MRLQGTQHDLIRMADHDWYAVPPSMPFRDENGYNFVGYFMHDTLEWFQNPGKQRVDDHHIKELRGLTKAARSAKV